MRYWNHEGPWQFACEASWLRYKNQCCHIQYVHHPAERFLPVSLYLFLHTQQSMFRNRSKSERQCKTEWRRTNDERISCLLLGFAPLLSCLLCVAWRKGLHCADELVTHKYTDSKMQDQAFMTWCLASSSLLASSLTLTEQVKITQHRQQCITGDKVAPNGTGSGGVFHMECGSLVFTSQW